MSQSESQNLNNSDYKQSIRERNLTVIQDFNNKKANSHATIFVASMFALFSVLSLAQRIVSKSALAISTWNNVIFVLSIASYAVIWFFGLYSLLNFFYYSTVANRAEYRLVRGMERALVEEYKSSWKWVSKNFASFKVPEKPQNLIRRNTQAIGICVYGVIGFLPLSAFLVWFFLT